MIIRAMRLAVIILTLICFSSFGCSVKKDKKEQKVEIEKEAGANAVNIDNSKVESKIKDSRHAVAKENLGPMENRGQRVETKDRNGDGKPDIWIYYNENNEHIKSEADRNFDGKPDYTRYLIKGKIDREEGDVDFNGAIDTWVYYADGRKVKGERDTNGDNKSDIFIYYEADKIVGVEKDTNFDGKIDQTAGKIPNK